MSPLVGWATLEIAGEDFGTDPGIHDGAVAGFSNNFDLTELIIGADAHIYLIDLVDNGNRNSAFGPDEAFYVDTLTFTDPLGLLNKNGFNLYFNSLQLQGGASMSQIIDVAHIPEPSTYLMFALMISGLFYFRRYACKSEPN